MRIIEFSDGTTVIFNFFAWFIIHVASAIITFKMPDRFFEQDSWIYKSHSRENDDDIWQSVFKIKK